MYSKILHSILLSYYKIFSLSHKEVFSSLALPSSFQLLATGSLFSVSTELLCILNISDKRVTKCAVSDENFFHLQNFQGLAILQHLTVFHVSKGIILHCNNYISPSISQLLNICLIVLNHAIVLPSCINFYVDVVSFTLCIYLALEIQICMLTTYNHT